MIPKTQALIETVTQDSAIKAALESSCTGDHPAAEATMARLKAVQARQGLCWQSILLWAAAVLTLAATTYPSLKAILSIHEPNGLAIYNAMEAPPLPAGLSDSQRLLFADPIQDRVEQCRQLHLSDPQNPAFFAEYVQHSLSKQDALPPDTLETAARIAPDNALFLYLAAAQTGRNAVERQPSAKKNRKQRTVDGVNLPPPLDESSYRIEDRKAYEDALALIAKAAALPELESYTNPMMAAKCRLLPSRNLVEFTVSLIHAYGASSPLLSLMKISNLLNARAEELSASGDHEAFRTLAGQRDAFVHGLARNPDVTLLGELVNQAIASSTAAQFHAAAERLGLADLEARYREQKEAFQRDKDRRDIDRKQGRWEDFGHYSTMAGLALPAVRSQVASPPPLDDADLAPLRRAEHEWVTGLGLLQLALLILILAAAAALACQLIPRPYRLPAKQLAATLDSVDRCWILVPGISLPIGFFLLMRITPLSGHSHSFMHFLFTFPGVHLIALGLGLLILPALLTRWRLARRLAALGVKPPTRRRSAILLAGLLIPPLAAYPVLTRVDFSALSLCVLAAPFALALIAWLADPLRRMIRQPAERIFCASTAIAVLPALAVAIPAICALTPIHRAAEKTWMARETLMRIRPDAPDLGTHEGKIAAQKRREVRAMLGLE